MDAPPIPRLVDLVHVFKGVVVEQFKKTLEKLLSDSILLWRLLKLLFKILQWRSWVGSSVLIYSSTLLVIVTPRFPSYSPFYYSLVLIPDGERRRQTPQQQQEEGEPATSGKKECPRKSDSLFSLSDSSKKAQRREVRCRLYEIQCELEKLKMGAEGDSEESDVAENFCRSKSTAVYQECPIKPEKFPGTFFNRWELWVKHFKSVVKANGWSDMQAIEALPACLTSWAVENLKPYPAIMLKKFWGRRRHNLTRY